MTQTTVLHVIESMQTGGAEKMVVEMARQASPEFRVLVCALNRGGPALEEAEAAGGEGWVLGKGAQRLQAIGRLARLMREQRVEVVHGHNPSGSLYGLFAAWKVGVPARVRTEHSIRYPGRHSAVYPLLERTMNAIAQRVVCVSESVGRTHAAATPAHKLVVIENGVGEAPPGRGRAEVRAELGEPLDAPVALTVGSLTPQKAHEVLLLAMVHALRDVPAARLWIAGDGPRRAELEARARELGVADSVRFLGPRADVHDLHGASDLFLLSSRREGLSIALLEAMRASRAALVTDVGGNADAVQHGVTGLVVPPENAVDLGAGLSKLLGDPATRATMGEAAHASWRDRFTARRMVARTEAMYLELLGRRPRHS